VKGLSRPRSRYSVPTAEVADRDDRCHRLNKECQPTSGVRKKLGKRASSSRTAQLEERLDDLVTLLKSKELIPGAGDDKPPTAIGNTIQPTLDDLAEASASASRSNDPLSASAQQNAHLPTPTDTSLYSTTGTSPAPTATVVDEISPTDAEEHLNYFRKKAMYFPFIYIPPTMTAAEFRAERPLTWLAIMLASSKSTPQQVAIGHKIRRIAAEKLLIEHDRSIDLLNMLLAFLGWANYQLGPSSRPFLCMYMHLAMSLTYDLGLTKPFADPSISNPACFKSHGVSPWKLPPQGPRTMEDRRSVLACYLISAS
jgi:hypothetical protein